MCVFCQSALASSTFPLIIRGLIRGCLIMLPLKPSSVMKSNTNEWKLICSRFCTLWGGWFAVIPPGMAAPNGIELINRSSAGQTRTTHRQIYPFLTLSDLWPCRCGHPEAEGSTAPPQTWSGRPRRPGALGTWWRPCWSTRVERSAPLPHPTLHLFLSTLLPM